MEAEQVAALFRRAAPDPVVDLMLDCEARAPRVRASARGKVCLHFASHALLAPSERPMDSAIALARPETIEHGDTGYLSIADLLLDWGGRLQGCDLVTLSACRTSRGVTIGDSLMALPLGLLHAGARCVLASLWSVPDLPTWLLMRRFYENHLGVRHDPADDDPRPVWAHIGLPGAPLPGPAALTEAKRWLRQLTVEQIAAELDDACDTATEQQRPILSAQARLLAKWDAEGTRHPFQHPENWAAFIFIGDIK